MISCDLQFHPMFNLAAGSDDILGDIIRCFQKSQIPDLSLQCDPLEMLNWLRSYLGPKSTGKVDQVKSCNCETSKTTQQLEDSIRLPLPTSRCRHRDLKVLMENSFNDRVTQSECPTCSAGYSTS